MQVSWKLKALAKLPLILDLEFHDLLKRNTLTNIFEEMFLEVLLCLVSNSSSELLYWPILFSVINLIAADFLQNYRIIYFSASQSYRKSKKI